MPGLLEGCVGLAHAAAMNWLISEEHDACRRHYTDDQITAIVAVCALFGFLNPWNDTMTTALEPTPRDVADRVLAPQGWTPGKHT